MSIQDENRQMFEWLTDLVEALDDGKIRDLCRRNRDGVIIAMIDEEIRQFVEDRS